MENTIYDWLNKVGVPYGSSIPKGSTYILPKGEFADLIGAKFRTHGALDLRLTASGYEPENEMTYLIPIDYFNCIRCNDGSNFLGEKVIDLPKDKPTYDQFDSIEKYLEYISTKSSIVIIASTVNKLDGVAYNLNETSPSKIVAKIKNYYSSGLLHEILEV